MSNTSMPTAHTGRRGGRTDLGKQPCQRAAGPTGALAIPTQRRIRRKECPCEPTPGLPKVARRPCSNRTQIRPDSTGLHDGVAADENSHPVLIGPQLRFDRCHLE